MSVRERPSRRPLTDSVSALVAAQPLHHCWLACARSLAFDHPRMANHECRTLRLRHTTIPMALVQASSPVRYASLSKYCPEPKRGSRRERINRSSTLHPPALVRGSLQTGARRDYRTLADLSRNGVQSMCAVRMPAFPPGPARLCGRSPGTISDNPVIVSSAAHYVK
jgi:hypothetical protein